MQEMRSELVLAGLVSWWFLFGLRVAHGWSGDFVQVGALLRLGDRQERIRSSANKIDLLTSLATPLSLWMYFTHPGTASWTIPASLTIGIDLLRIVSICALLCILGPALEST